MSTSKFELKSLILVALPVPILFFPLGFVFLGAWGLALVCACIAAVYYSLILRWHRNAQADDQLAHAASHDATGTGRPTDSDPRSSSAYSPPSRRSPFSGVDPASRRGVDTLERMDMAMLRVNLGVFVASSVAAWVAWE